MNKYKKFGFFLVGLYPILTLWIASFDYILANFYFFSLIFLVILLIVLVCPIVLRPLYIVWMFIGHWLGIINTYIIFTIIYFIIITPISILTHLFSKKRSITNWAEIQSDEQTDFNKQY